MTREQKREKITELKNKIYDKIDSDLRSATLVFVKDEDGNGYPLIDYLSSGNDISNGRIEIGHIVEQIELDKELDAILALDEKPESLYEKEFAQYCAESVFDDFDQEIDDFGIYHYICLKKGEDYSFDEFYSYWLNNIKEK